MTEEKKKAIVSNRIYFRATGTILRAVRDALTYKIEHKNTGRGKHIVVEVIKNYKLLPNDIISIPQGRQDLIPEGYEIVDKRVYNEMPFPLPSSDPRPEQKEIIDQVTDTCFINAPVGWGKTYTALHIARKLEQKTLIVTHTTILRDQWIEEIEKLFGMQVGKIGAGEYDIDHAIVVGNVQSVTKYSLELSKEFGTIIMDEAHHTPASTFTGIIDQSYARYRIALSGTMIRSDGKHVMFKDFFGDTVYKPEQSHTLNPTVKILKSGIQLTPGVTWVKKINDLLYSEEYQEYIATIAAAQIKKGHSVLIIADRVEFLEKVKELLGEACVLVTGSTAYEERKIAAEKIESGEKSCIAGSRQIFSEGISINRLSCVILAIPIANVANLEQIIGRIMRMHPKKIHPEVIDINFSGYADRKQNTLRLGHYLDRGYEVETI